MRIVNLKEANVLRMKVREILETLINTNTLKKFIEENWDKLGYMSKDSMKTSLKSRLFFNFDKHSLTRNRINRELELYEVLKDFMKKEGVKIGDFKPYAELAFFDFALDELTSQKLLEMKKRDLEVLGEYDVYEDEIILLKIKAKDIKEAKKKVVEKLKIVEELIK